MAKVSNEQDDIAVSVSGVSKYFPPNKGQGSLKQLFTSAFKKREIVDKGYWALKNIDFTVKKGEFFGIVGRNGSGKSTLLKMIAGVYSPTKGDISVHGKLVPFIELGVGFNPELSGRDNVFLNGALLGFSRKEMTAMYNEIVEFAELEEHMDVKLKNYSSGMHVRLAFSIAVRAKADILLIDEVLAVGDAAFQQKCFNYFEDLKQHNKTVIFVSHDMGSVRRFCNRATYIKEGKQIYCGDVSVVADMYVEENLASASIEQEPSDTQESVLNNGCDISLLIDESSEDFINLTADYNSNIDDALYVGISILWNGVSVAELTTEKELTLNSRGSVSYKIKKNIFNSGAFTISGGLFRLSNRELLAAFKHSKSFVIKGSDSSRGGPIRLEGGWKTPK